jgi:hypothetical protein
MPGEPHVLSALVFDLEDALHWSFCAEAWRPTDPPDCPSGAVALGRGNPLVTTLPELDSGWVLASPLDGGALPAVKRLESGTEAANPEVSGILVETSPESREGVALRVVLAEGRDPTTLVVSWYVTAGTLEPKRTLASEAAILTAPEPAAAPRVIAVVREEAGGTGWTETTLELGAPRP